LELKYDNPACNPLSSVAFHFNVRPYVMGAKTALLQMRGNPVVMFADTTDIMFSCSESEILQRFEDVDADILIGGESQLWPEIETYFDMKAEKEQTDKVSAGIDRSIGLRKHAEKPGPDNDQRPNKWANGGVWMGRKTDLLKYYEVGAVQLEPGMKARLNPG